MSEFKKKSRSTLNGTQVWNNVWGLKRLIRNCSPYLLNPVEMPAVDETNRTWQSLKPGESKSPFYLILFEIKETLLTESLAGYFVPNDKVCRRLTYDNSKPLYEY